jgi:hypothetical protein
VTFCKAFGLSLYSSQRRPTGRSKKAAQARDRVGLPPANANGAEITIRELPGNHPGLVGHIDKSQLALSEPRRLRDKDHLRYVASQPCIVCNRILAEAHHVRFAQPKALGIKVSDEFTMPLCRDHHRELHNNGNERAWWHDMGIDPLPVAKRLWEESHTTDTAAAIASGHRPVAVTRGVMAKAQQKQPDQAGTQALSART